MKILIACEESQAVCIAFREKGFEAYSCDLQECSGGHPEWHFNMSIWDCINGGYLTTQSGEVVYIDKWNKMIGHPPCTYITVTANKWLKDQPPRKSGKLVGAERRAAKKEAEDFFLKLLNSPIDMICLENPIGSINSIIPPTQIIHPYYFGDATSKATCLWLKNLPKLTWSKEDNLFDRKTCVDPQIYISSTGKKHDTWYMESASIRNLEERAKFRSKTFPGIANAMATQWGEYLLSKQKAA